MNAEQKLQDLFDSLPFEMKMLAEDTYHEYVYFTERIKELEKLPMVRTHPNDKTKQKLTPASKLIKEFSTAVDSKRATLIRIFSRNEVSAEDELISILKEYQ